MRLSPRRRTLTLASESEPPSPPRVPCHIWQSVDVLLCPGGERGSPAAHCQCAPLCPICERGGSEEEERVSRSVVMVPNCAKREGRDCTEARRQAYPEIPQQHISDRGGVPDAPFPNFSSGLLSSLFHAFPAPHPAKVAYIYWLPIHFSLSRPIFCGVVKLDGPWA